MAPVDEALFNPTPEHTMLRETVRRFAETEVEPQAEDHDESGTLNVGLLRRCGDLGLLGLTVPVDEGGAGMDAVAAVIAHHELGKHDPGFTLAYLAHFVLFVNNFTHASNPAQRARILPRVLSGEWIGAMAMTEPSAGTDVLGMQTTAVRAGDHYRLNGAKMWITNGAVSDTELGDVFLVYARTGGRGVRSLSLLVVERGMAGFRLGQKIKDKLGMRASTTAELVFEECLVPAANLLGREGDAVGHMMRNLEIERLTLSAMSLGIARRCVEVMNRYAAERKAFGQPLNEFGQVQRHIAEAYAHFMAGRSYVYQVAGALDLATSGNRIDSDGVKLFCATMAKQVADSAIQVLGGYGYVGEYRVERLWRDAKLLEIGGGTIEAHQKNMTADLARGDGVIR